MTRLLNLGITALWFGIFAHQNWITFTANMPTWQLLVFSALVAWLVEVLANWARSLVTVVSCGCAIFFYPVFSICLGWIMIWGTKELTNFYTINVTFFWIGLVMSIAMGLLRIPSMQVTASAEVSRSTSNDSD